MNSRKRVLSSLLLIVISIFIIIYSCKKDSDEGAPVIPPLSTIAIDFPTFSSLKDGSVNLTNWQYSNVSLALWNTFLNKDCIIPVSSFKKVVEQPASLVDDHSWEWKNTLLTDSNQIIVTLQGNVSKDSVDWKLWITIKKNQELTTPFIWIEGKSASDQSGGRWIIFESPSIPEPYLIIDWTKHNNEPESVKYTFVKPGYPETGYYLIYNSKTDYFSSNYSIKLHNNQYIYIEMNKDSQEGRVKSPFIFNDTEWHCWDSHQMNVDCSN